MCQSSPISGRHLLLNSEHLAILKDLRAMRQGFACGRDNNLRQLKISSRRSDSRFGSHFGNAIKLGQLLINMNCKFFIDFLVHSCKTTNCGNSMKHNARRLVGNPS